MARQRLQHRGVDLTVQSDGSVTLGDNGPKIGQVKRGGGSSVHYWYPDMEICATPGTKSASAAVAFDNWLIKQLSADGQANSIAKDVVQLELHLVESKLEELTKSAHPLRAGMAE